MCARLLTSSLVPRRAGQLLFHRVHFAIFSLRDFEEEAKRVFARRLQTFFRKQGKIRDKRDGEAANK